MADGEDGLGLGSIAESEGGPRLPGGSYGSREGQNEGMRRASSSTARERLYGEEDLVPVGFDEGVLRGLCDLDCGMPLLLDRMKQSMASCREASLFLKKRAIIEEEYARSMVKLARSSAESYSLSDGKSGSYVQSWISLLRTHELLGDNRLKFAQQLNEMGDELGGINREVEKNRKSSRDLGTRLERGLSEQEALVDKARVRFDSAAEELERLLLIKQGESLRDPIAPYTSNAPPGGKQRTFGKAMSKLKGPKTVAQLAKQEEEVRSRMGQSSDSYRAQMIGMQSVQQDYFSVQLPKILRSLKESVDELDLGTQYHLSRYAFLFESTIVTDGLTISPVNFDEGASAFVPYRPEYKLMEAIFTGPGLKSVVDSIDIREDFKTFMNQFALSWQMSGQRGPKRDSEGHEPRAVISPRPSMSSSTSHQQGFTGPPSRPTFGVDLSEQMQRDGVEVPKILEKCCEAIELHGLESMGIYRLSGTTSRVQRLKAKLDRDVDRTDLLSEENLTDINDTAAVIKLWFREMPEPLLTWELYYGFIEAAKIENDRLRHIRLHERVNELPDANYATLKYLMGHLDKVKSRESVNQMSTSNLAIVFGPNLLGAPPNQNGGQGTALADMSWQCKCVETILQHYVEIFVDTDGA
ncbi:Rho GTPase-activating protein RGD1, partial [Phenoliferia sp. Uapishka_3]